MSVVHWTAGNGYAETLKVVVEPGGGLNGSLFRAASRNQVEVIDVLVGAGADIRREDHRPLHAATCSFYGGAVLALLKHVADTNARDMEGQAPLHWAASCAGKEGASEMADLLLRSGADETIIDNTGDTAAGVVGLWLEGDPLVARRTSSSAAGGRSHGQSMAPPGLPDAVTCSPRQVASAA